MADTLQNIRDGYKGTPAYGINATLISSTTPVTILAAPGAGFHYEIRRIRIVNVTPAETSVITVQDEDDNRLFVGVAHDPATAVPVDDTGWLDQAIPVVSNKIVEAEGTATGDSWVMIWADKVAD